MKENSKNSIDISLTGEKVKSNKSPTKIGKTLKTILLIDDLDPSFGKNDKQNRNKSSKKVSKEEENLLTLIANIIVEIVLREEL